jgi:hypothetical protein
MAFVLMKLQFPETSPKYVNGCKPPMSPALPTFKHIMEFKTAGVVMNVFLLDPPQRLLSAFVWVSASNTIGLYALLDWNKREYVFIDTGIECVSGQQPDLMTSTHADQLLSSNWSCILSEDNVVIHSEEDDVAFQHFYPISLLQKYSRKRPEGSAIPIIAGRVSPALTQSKGFIFPLKASEVLAAGGGYIKSRNPFPFPQWYPESAHFVRQWWPTLPGLPRLSCTVVLLATHDQSTHRTRFVLAQHYFKVPMASPTWGSRHDYDATTTTSRDDGDDPLMRLWYVSKPFEVVCVVDGSDDEDEVEANSSRPRPLVAVDFGHAAWIEYVDEERGGEGTEKKWLRFATFPPVCDEGGCVNMERVGGGVERLEVPDELELDNVETINIDQSQGAVILSVKEGKIFILCYE